MLSILIGPPIAIIITIFVLRRWTSDDALKALPVIGICALLLTASIVIPLTWTEFVDVPTQTSSTETKTPIVALKDNSLLEGRISGGIFVISGYIQQEPVYFYYKQVGDGFLQEYIQAKGVIIYEDTKDEGYILHRTTLTETDSAFKQKYGRWIVITGGARQIAIEIHVPEGTIARDFKLDLE